MQELGITSDEALVLDNVPEGGTIVIVGAGYIAVEFAGEVALCFCTAHAARLQHQWSAGVATLRWSLQARFWVAPALLTPLERWNSSGVQGVGCIAGQIAGASGAC